jgi:hypothetical protein
MGAGCQIRNPVVHFALNAYVLWNLASLILAVIDEVAITFDA